MHGEALVGEDITYEDIELVYVQHRNGRFHGVGPSRCLPEGAVLHCE